MTRSALPIAAALALLSFAASPLTAAPKAREFVISFWSPPPPGETTEARYREMAAAGFNVALGGNGVEGPELSRRMLDLCQKVGLKAMVLDPRLYGGKSDGVEAVVKDYGGHPALYGYLVKDEPSAADFPALAQTVQALRKRDPKHLALINLFPTYATPQQLGSPSYEDHVGTYLETVKPEVLSFDHYPLLSQGMRQDFYTNLEIIRQQSLKAKVPFWAIVQAEGIEGAYRSPSPSEMRWQVYQSLAYGAHGILYFTYWTPEPGVEKHFDGIVTRDGKARSRYTTVKELNAELKALGPILSTTRALEVYHIGVPAPGGKAFSEDNLMSVLSATGDPATITFLRGEGSKRYILVANRDPARSGKVDVAFKGDVERCREILKTGQRGDDLLRADLNLTPEITVSLDAGDGRLYELELNGR